MIDSFNDKIRDAAQELHAAAAHAAIRPTLLRQSELRKIYNSLPVAVRKRAFVGASMFNSEVFISCHLYDLDSFKDDRLLKVLAPFANWEAHTNDYTYNVPNRDFRFEKKFIWEHDTRSIAYKKLVKLDKLPQTYTINVGVYAYVKEDSPLCRIVVTGTKEEVVRTEVKQIVCA